MSKKTPKLVLSKESLKDLRVQSNVRTGGIIAPGYTQNPLVCRNPPPRGPGATGLDCLM
jgi:hypothetical protein